MKISIEKRKAKDGKLSLRLVYYYGHTKDDAGKITHHRDREKLDAYLYADPKTSIERQHNKETNILIEAIKAKRIVEHESGKHGFKKRVTTKASFVRFFEQMMEQKKQETSHSNYSVWDSSYKHLVSYIGKPELSLDEVTMDFATGFKAYLENKAVKKSGEKISQNTASAYFNKFRATVHEAYRKGLIPENPLNDVKSIKQQNNKREYLEIAELKQLAQTDCRYEVLKRAFLFSCLTGMRWSDIHKLDWKDIISSNEGHRVIFHQKKTDGLQYLDLSSQAYSLLGEQQKEGRPFRGLRYNAYMNTELLRWCMAAGISKHITFHAGRHTFAVAQLTMGTDIYTVSKLLGHSELKTTQIYADIIDAHRKTAMHKIPDIGL